MWPLAAGYAPSGDRPQNRGSGTTWLLAVEVFCQVVYIGFLPGDA